MNRLIRNSFLALSAVAGLTSSATAQFLPSPFGLPVLPYRYFAQQVMVNNMGVNYSLNFVRTSPMGYSYSYIPSQIPNPIYESQARALREARQQMNSSAPAEPAQAKSAFSNLVRTDIGTGRTVDTEIERINNESFIGLPTAFKTAIVSPKSSDISSGKSLNDLLATTIDLEKRFGRGNGSFLAPEVLASLRFTGNANADLSNWVRKGEIEFPDVFKTQEYTIPRVWLKNDFGIIASNLIAGKTPDSSLYQALVTAGKTIRRTFDERKAGLTADDRRKAEEFLARYDAVANIIRLPNTSELCSTDFSSMGVGLVELVEYMSRYKLQFGSVPVGHESAYEMLHRALSAYAMTLVELRR